MRPLAAAAVVALAATLIGLVVWKSRDAGEGPRAGAAAGGAAPAPRRMTSEGPPPSPPPFDPAAASPEERRNAPPVVPPNPPDASVLTDPRAGAVADDAQEQLLALARPCVARARNKPQAGWWIRVRFDLVVERGVGRLDNVEVLDTEMNDPALLGCVLDGIKAARLQSVREDLRISVEHYIPIGRL